MNGLDKFKQRYDQAIADIQSYRVPSNKPDCMAGLVEWMLTTNSYSYIQEGYYPYTAEDMCSTLRAIYNGLYDDGSLSFVTVNGEPRIIFAHPNDFNTFDEFVQKSVLFDIEKSLIESYLEMPEYGFCYNVKLLDINPSEFGPLYDAYEAECARIDAELRETV